jgi:two-component sensor histidine kinase
LDAGGDGGIDHLAATMDLSHSRTVLEAYAAAVALLDRAALERADLRPGDEQILGRLIREWDVLADLAMSDLLLWLPTWNDAGFVVAAHVRPTTAATVVPDQVVGTFWARGRTAALDQALVHGRKVTSRNVDHPAQCVGPETYPVTADDRVIAVIERRPSANLRTAGRLEEVYLLIADQLFGMLVDGTFPPIDAIVEATGSTRVGDGLLHLDATGVIIYASPNAVGALRRLGLAQDPVQMSFTDITQRLLRKHGVVPRQITSIASGNVAGRIDLEVDDVTVLVRGMPLSDGAMIMVRDVTETRRRDRQLLSKDATIREIHHRVKNNLQTVAALLRLQGRRASGDEAKGALAEAQMRIAAIAVVHDLLATGGAGDVPFAEVVDRVIAMIAELAPAYGAGDVRITRDGSCGALSADVTTPLAMATTELIQNAVEHANAQHIRVFLTRRGNAVQVRVQDDGVGIPMPASGDGLGLSIVESLMTGELRGSFTIHGDTSGTVATLDLVVG